MDVRKTHLYRTLLPCIRKEDQERFCEELQRAADSAQNFYGDASEIREAFVWFRSPQGHRFWSELDTSLRSSGHYAENERLVRRRK